jgi:hypothetical protein
LPKGKDRDKAFADVRKTYRYSDYDLQAYATTLSNNSKWIALKIDSNTQQKLATRAFKASEKVLFKRAKKVRFKVPNRFRSLEGKTNKQGIRWKQYQQSVNRVSASESGLTDSPPERISQKLGTVNQISQFGLKVNLDSSA